MPALKKLCLGLVLFGAAAAVSLGVHPRCSDQGYFPADAGPSDGSPWTYDNLQPEPDLYVNPCAPQPPPSISGKVFAPNGTDPVAGASIYVPLALAPMPPSVDCSTCVVKGKFSAQTYSGADGSFKLVGVPNGSFKLGIQKGHFRRVVEVTVPTCGHLDLPKEQSVLPGKNGQWSGLDSVPSIAVISGAYDHMEKVLDKLGVKERTVYNGKDWATGPTVRFRGAGRLARARAKLPPRLRAAGRPPLCHRSLL
jgi:hypothetical protein